MSIPIALTDAFHAQSSRSVISQGNSWLHSPNKKNPDNAQDPTAEENGSCHRNEFPSNLQARDMEKQSPNSSLTLQRVCNLFTCIT
jgi:hypothetical protein